MPHFEVAWCSKQKSFFTSQAVVMTTEHGMQNGFSLPMPILIQTVLKLWMENKLIDYIVNMQFMLKPSCFPYFKPVSNHKSKAKQIGFPVHMHANCVGPV